MELVERHLLLQELPAELGLVVNEGDLVDGVTLPGVVGVKLLGHLHGGLLEFLEEAGGDGKEIDTSEGLDLVDLVSGDG
jgi:hypothetical protein